MSERNILDDENTVAAWRQGNLAAFEQIVISHQKSMYNVAYRISGNEADAADIVQDAFISAWKKICDFRGESKLSTWLINITINQARTRWQQNRQKQRREDCLDQPSEKGDSAPLQVASGRPSALELLEQDQLRELLERCINALENGFREVLVLRDMREMAYEEVAQALGLRDGTVKSRLFRAREAVRDCVTREMGRP